MSGFIKNLINAEDVNSYSLALKIPFDPITGSNAAIETNPKGREQLTNAVELLEQSHPGILAKLRPNDPKLAATKFLTKVGIHGELHAHEIGPLAGLGFAPQTIPDGNPGVQISQEGMFGDILKAIFKSSPRNEKAADKLARLEKAAAETKNEATKAYLAGNIKPSDALIERLTELADKTAAPVQVYAANQNNLAILRELTKYGDYNGDGLYEDLGEAKTAEEAKGYLLKFFKVFDPCLPLWNKFKPIKKANATPQQLFADVVSNYNKNQSIVKSIIWSKYSSLTLPVHFHQPIGRVVGMMEGGNGGSGLSELEESDPEFYWKASEHVELIEDKCDEFEDAIYDSKYYAVFDYLLHGRILVLEEALQLQLSKEEVDYTTDPGAELWSTVWANAVRSVDPTDPSYTQESLVEAMYVKAAAELKRIVTQGGLPKRVSSGKLGRWLQHEASRFSQESFWDNFSDPTGYVVEGIDELHVDSQGVTAMQHLNLATHKLSLECSGGSEQLDEDLQCYLKELQTKKPGLVVLGSFYKNGILKNKEEITKILTEQFGATCAAGLIDVLDLDRYASGFDLKHLPGRCTAIFNYNPQYMELLGNASNYLLGVADSKLLDYVRDQSAVDTQKALEMIATVNTNKLDELPVGIEQSPEAVIAYLDAIDRDNDKPFAQIEASAADFGGLSGFADYVWNCYVDREKLTMFSPKVLLTQCSKFPTETQEILKAIAVNIAKAALVVEYAGVEPKSWLNGLRDNVHRKVLQLLVRCIDLVDKDSLSMEGISYVDTSKLDNDLQDPVAKEYLGKNLFGWGKPKEKVRETSKPPKEWRLGLLLAEQQEYQNKALAKYSELTALRTLHQEGVADAAPLYTPIAQAVGVGNYDHSKYYAGYLKAQSGSTLFLLDYAIQCKTPDSKLQQLIKATIDFTDEYLKAENPLSVYKAYTTPVGTEEPTAQALRVASKFKEYNIVKLYKGIEQATDVIKPKNKYNISLLEHEAQQADDFDSNTNGNTNNRVYSVYQNLCVQLRAANELAEYLLTKNRPLGVMYSELRDQLYAMADVLAYQLYAYNALDTAHQNLVVARISFFELVANN